MAGFPLVVPLNQPQIGDCGFLVAFVLFSEGTPKVVVGLFGFPLNQPKIEYQKETESVRLGILG